MTTIAGGAEVLVIAHVGVMRISLRLGMGMAIYAFKGGEVGLVDMAVGAGCPSSLMGSGVDREIGGVMVPGRVGPVAGVMTGLAGGREIRGRMHRIVGAVIIALMAGIAVGRGARKAGGMAGNTGDGGMLSGQRETGGVMIKCRRRPAAGRMAAATVMAEIILHVVGVGRLLEIGLMAGIAIGGCPGVGGGVAVRTKRRDMLAGQGKTGGTVIETAGGPAAGRMAGGTLMIEIGQQMVGVVAVLEISLMTRITISRCTGVRSRVAGDAGHGLMPAGQREGGLIVIIRGRCPAVGGMANRALAAEAGLAVVRVFGRREFGRVAVIAGG